MISRTYFRSGESARRKAFSIKAILDVINILPKEYSAIKNLIQIDFSKSERENYSVRGYESFIYSISPESLIAHITNSFNNHKDERNFY